jgi:hypothetical protein
VIKAVLSDIYTTLIDIKTREDDLDLYERLAAYLKYQGIYLSPEELQWFFFEKKSLQKSTVMSRIPRTTTAEYGTRYCTKTSTHIRGLTSTRLPSSVTSSECSDLWP